VNKRLLGKLMQQSTSEAMVAVAAKHGELLDGKDRSPKPGSAV